MIDINIVMDEFWFTAKQEMDFLNKARFAMDFARNNADITYIDAPLVKTGIYNKPRTGDGIHRRYHLLTMRRRLEQGGYDTHEIASGAWRENLQ